MKFLKWLMFAAVAAGMVTGTYALDPDEYVQTFRIVKIWDDDSNRCGIRPRTAEFNLSGVDSGTTYFSTNVVITCPSGTNCAETTIYDVPTCIKFEDYHHILTYTLTELNVPDYYKPDIVNEGDLWFSWLKVNDASCARIASDESLVFRAGVRKNGHEIKSGSVDWSYDLGNGPQRATTEISPDGYATFTLNYNDVSAIVANSNYVMTATYSEPLRSVSDKVCFGIRGDMPSIIFVEPEREISVGCNDAVHLKVVAYKGKKSETLHETWSVSDPGGLAPGYAVPVQNAEEADFSFSKPGTYKVTATVSDGEGKTGSDTVFIHVFPAPFTDCHNMIVVTNTLVPTVSGVVARQRWPWNGLVDVDYDVLGNTDGMKAEIEFNEDGGGGRSWKAAKFLPGCEPSAAPGHHRATWTAPEDTRANVKATVRLVREVLKD